MSSLPGFTYLPALSASFIFDHSSTPLMKVLLRDRQTGLFYVGLDQWTAEHGLARSFESPASALEEVSTSSLAGVELICHFENPGFDLPLTIHSAGA